MDVQILTDILSVSWVLKKYSQRKIYSAMVFFGEAMHCHCPPRKSLERPARQRRTSDNYSVNGSFVNSSGIPEGSAELGSIQLATSACSNEMVTIPQIHLIARNDAQIATGFTPSTPSLPPFLLGTQKRAATNKQTHHRPGVQPIRSTNHHAS